MSLITSDFWRRTRFTIINWWLDKVRSAILAMTEPVILDPMPVERHWSVISSFPLEDQVMLHRVREEHLDESSWAPGTGVTGLPGDHLDTSSDQELLDHANGSRLPETAPEPSEWTEKDEHPGADESWADVLHNLPEGRLLPDDFEPDPVHEPEPVVGPLMWVETLAEYEERTWAETFHDFDERYEQICREWTDSLDERGICPRETINQVFIEVLEEERRVAVTAALELASMTQEMKLVSV